MSIAHSKGDPKGQTDGGEGWQLLSSIKSPKKPTQLTQPSHRVDVENPVFHVNGNCKPQEPLHMRRRVSSSKSEPRMAGHIHTKPWSTSIAPGRKENPHHVSSYHRVWMGDTGGDGRPLDGIDYMQNFGAPRRWNRARKTEYYNKYLEELYNLKPHDEKFSTGATVRFWTHLEGHGSKVGGHEKLDYVPNRGSGTQLGPLYRGKYANIKPAQIMCQTGRRNEKKELEEWVVDIRPPFDNRLHDDQVRHNDETDKKNAEIAFSFARPINTRSCTQMGVEFLHR